MLKLALVAIVLWDRGERWGFPWPSGAQTSESCTCLYSEQGGGVRVAGWWGSWARSPCLAAELTAAKERPGKLIHFAGEVGWARASEGPKE